MPDSVYLERDGAIATVVLNRPEKLNALTRSMWQTLGDAVEELSQDRSIRCILLRGAGEKAFSPGNDIAEFATERANKAQAIEYGAIMHATARALEECRHPIVAQIHGICVGGGLEIAAFADIRVCGESSRFGAPIKNLGLVMAYPEMAPLVRLAGEIVPREANLAVARALGLAEDLGRFGLPESSEIHVSAEGDPAGFTLALSGVNPRVILGWDDLEPKLRELARVLAAELPEFASATELDLRFAGQGILRNDPLPEGAEQAAAGRGYAPPST